MIMLLIVIMIVTQIHSTARLASSAERLPGAEFASASEHGDFEQAAAAGVRHGHVPAALFAEGKSSAASEILDA
jgi:hypothetical protein